MEMPFSLRGDKHEFCLVVTKIKHVRSCPTFDITDHREEARRWRNAVIIL